VDRSEMTGQGNAASLDSIWRLRGACSGNDSGILVEPYTYPVENAVCPANLDSTGQGEIKLLSLRIRKDWQRWLTPERTSTSLVHL